LSAKDVLLPLVVRTRKVGDRMFLKGVDGSKKVKDIFIDKKTVYAENPVFKNGNGVCIGR